MADLLRLWEQGFHESHPAVLFDDQLKGTIPGMGGLYSGVIDLSLMGREIWPAESICDRLFASFSATFSAMKDSAR